MSFKRIRTIILHSWFYQKHSFEAWIDTLWWSIVSLAVFGFMSVFFAGGAGSEKATYIILGFMLWDIVRQGQETLSFSILRDIWSRNLSNLFTTPLTVYEFITALMIFGLVKTVFIFAIISVLAYYFYQFSVLQLGFFLPVVFFSLLWFSWSAGIFILGLLFRFGTRLQALTWSLIVILQPITGVFYPVEILPPALQFIARFFPITYIFAAARQLYLTQTVNPDTLAVIFVQNIVYFLLALWFFVKMFESSKKSGEFARLES